MKKIKFTCTNCDAKLRVPTHLAGVSAPCPKCGATITAPSDITEAVEDDEPRRAPAPVSSAGATAARSHREAPVSREASHAGSATALAEPPPLAAPAKASVPVPASVQVPVPAAKLDPVVVPASPEPTPILPKTTTSVEIPTPASRPLQPRPITPPVPAESAPAESAPAFFTPPPPVRPITPVAPEPDLAADAPVSLPAADQVVVEVSSFPVPAPAPAPPASIITQPIQVNSRPSGLPEVRSEVSGAGSLPRLDISLAGQDLSGAAAVLFADNAGQPVRTRVQLPQPGVETHKFSPDDFIVPSSAPAVPPVPEAPVAEAPPALDEQDAFDPSHFAAEEATVENTPQPYTPIPLPGASDPIPLDELDDASYEDLPDFDAGDVHSYYPGPDPDEEESYFNDLSDDQIPPGLEAPAWSEEELAGEFVSAPPVEVPWNLQPASVPDDVDFREVEAPAPEAKKETPREDRYEDRYDEVPVNPLHEGSFGKLFSQQPGSVEEKPAPVVSTPAPEPEVIAPARSADALPAPITQAPAPPDGDVLEELFGGSLRSAENPKKLSKTAVVMISCLAGAAVIAILMVVLLGQLFLGGREPEDSFKEGSVVESTAEKSKGNVSAALITDDDPSLDDAPAVIDPVALPREPAIGAGTADTPPAEAPALSIDERVQQIVNGTGAAPATGGSVIGQPSLDLVDNGIDPLDTPIPIEAPAPTSATPPAPAPAPEAPPVSALDAAGSSLLGPAGNEPPGASSARSTGAAGKSANYNPPASFAAPGPDESPLLRVNDLIDAFLRAPDWQTRINYTYQGDSLRPAIEDYYKKWPDTKIDRYSQQLFQMEQSTELGGPYWVYLISTSDADQGFPLIIRVEDGNLKVDWEIYSEFNDRHFVRFRDGTMPRPSTFRVVIERVSDYYGTDREAFTNVKDYYVYQINPPYGDLNEFSEYAFVKKDSEVAKKLEKVVSLGDEPLAVIVTLDEEAFAHGVKHFVITDYLTEGWFR